MKRKTNIIILASLFLSALATSCITPRRVNYLQDMTQGSQIQIENKFEAAIAPYDELNIIVTTSSSKKELAAPFNFGAINNAATQNGGAINARDETSIDTVIFFNTDSKFKWWYVIDIISFVVICCAYLL